VGINEMRELIGRVAAAHRTVLVSSHILAELEQVCDWLLVIDDGRLVYAGDSEGFVGLAATEIVLAPGDLGSVLSLADVIAGRGYDVGRTGDELIVAVEAAEARQVAALLNEAAAAAGIVLAELHVRRPTLESHYLRLLEGATQ
jgi:ABC-2 type transport system ATP-binding protein